MIQQLPFVVTRNTSLLVSFHHSAPDTQNIYQIDTPYLDSQSNGLSVLIDKIKHHPIYAHVQLEKGERSELANLAGELL